MNEAEFQEKLADLIAEARASKNMSAKDVAETFLMAGTCLTYRYFQGTKTEMKQWITDVINLSIDASFKVEQHTEVLSVEEDRKN